MTPAVFAFVGKARQPMRTELVGIRYFPNPPGNFFADVTVSFLSAGRADSACSVGQCLLLPVARSVSFLWMWLQHSSPHTDLWKFFDNFFNLIFA